MLLRAAKQKRIYVVEARRHYDRCDRDCHVVIQRWADVPQWADVTETRFRYWLGVVIYSKVRIECGSKNFDSIWKWNNCALNNWITTFTGIEPGMNLTRWDVPKMVVTDSDGLKAIFAKPRVKGSQALLVSNTQIAYITIKPFCDHTFVMFLHFLQSLSEAQTLQRYNVDNRYNIDNYRYIMCQIHRYITILSTSFLHTYEANYVHS